MSETTWEAYKNRTIEVDPRHQEIQARRAALEAAATTPSAVARLAWFDETVWRANAAARTGYANHYWQKQLTRKLREPL